MSDRFDGAPRAARHHVSILDEHMLIRAGKGSKLVLQGVRTQDELRVQLTEPTER